MKLKKFLVIAVALCMFTLSQAAYANEVTPFATGIGDTEATALVRPFGINEFNTWLTDANDVDWYKYTNNTNTNHYIRAELWHPSTFVKYKFEAKIVYDALHSTSMLQSSNVGVFNLFQGLQIPPGATFYMKVSTDSSVFDPNDRFYKLWTNIYQ